MLHTCVWDVPSSFIVRSGYVCITHLSCFCSLSLICHPTPPSQDYLSIYQKSISLFPLVSSLAFEIIYTLGFSHARSYATFKLMCLTSLKIVVSRCILFLQDTEVSFLTAAYCMEVWCSSARAASGTSGEMGFLPPPPSRSFIHEGCSRWRPDFPY